MKISLLPIGSIECHGPHLPVDTDWLLAEAICKGVYEKLKGKMEIHGSVPAFKGLGRRSLE